MKRILSIFLTAILLFSIIVPTFATVEKSVPLSLEIKDNISFLDSMIDRISEIFEKIEAYFKKLFGNKPIDVPSQPPETIVSPNGEEMRLVWNDEFNSNSLDTSKWTLKAKMWQNDIINGNDEHNVKVEDGNLVLRTWKESDGKYSTNTSVTTDGIMSYQYGYLEIYANVPYVDGCWPSFWMQSKDIHRTVDYMTEIDVFEIYNTDNTVRSDIHKWYNGGTEHYNIGGQTKSYKFKRKINLNNEYHLYGFGWTSKEMYFTVDREIYYRYDLSQDFGDREDGMQGFNDPVYIIFNNFIFTENSSWKNPPVTDDTQWPITYKIDWIRLYQKTGEGQVFDDTDARN